MAMETKVINVTPELAKEWLEKNMANNRPVLKSTVHSYARMMRNGGWKLTHQGIAFDQNGELIDGQHRLSAVIEANIPVRMNVSYDVTRNPGEVFTIDMGRKRTYANVAMMSGMTDPVYRYCGSFVSTYIKYKLPGNRKSDPAEIMDYIDRHYDDIAKLFSYVSGGTHGHGPGDSNSRIPAIVGAAMLAAIYRGEEDSALAKFAQVYKKNDVSGCERFNPKYALNLRDYVRKFRNSGDLYDRCESAIWAFSRNLSAFRIRNNCYPLNAALDQ